MYFRKEARFVRGFFFFENFYFTVFLPLYQSKFNPKNTLLDFL